MSSNKIPPKTKNGVKVQYPAAEEHYLRTIAREAGFSSVQEYLKWKAYRERNGLPTDIESAKRR